MIFNKNRARSAFSETFHFSLFTFHFFATKAKGVSR